MVPDLPPVQYNVSCPRADQPIHIDGRVSDPQWQRATPLQLNDAFTGSTGRYATSVRILYDDRYLYVAFSCKDDYIWGTCTQRDAAIYDEECVEVFVNPSGCDHQYYEINLSPKNVVFDACILNQRTSDRPDAPFTGLPGWNLAELKTAVNIDGALDVPGGATAWSAEFAIPLNALYGAKHLPPQPGDVWRINFYRIDTPEPGKQELYAWCPPLAGTFHRPWRFGWLKFL